METRIQALIITIVGAMGGMALGGAITLAFHGKTVPEALTLLSSNVVSGLCGALSANAIKALSQKITGDNPTVTDVTERTGTLAPA